MSEKEKEKERKRMEVEMVTYPDGKVILGRDKDGHVVMIEVYWKNDHIIMDTWRGLINLESPNAMITLSYEGVKGFRPLLFEDIEEGTAYTRSRDMLNEIINYLRGFLDDVHEDISYEYYKD